MGIEGARVWAADGGVWIVSAGLVTAAPSNNAVHSLWTRTSDLESYEKCRRRYTTTQVFNALAQIDRLKVLARTSVFSFKRSRNSATAAAPGAQ
jgi:hypothetical protein